MRAWARLARDTHGAAMVSGLFMACFVVGVLFHVVSVGQAIAYRNRVQAVADRAAFDAAVGYARSTNEIALANDIQMIAVANVFALQVGRDYLEACAPAAAWGGPEQALCPSELERVSAIYDRAVPSLVSLSASMSESAATLRDATPGLAIADAAQLPRETGLGARSGVALLAPPMALETETLLVQCARTGPLVSELLARSSIPLDLVERFSLPPRVPISPMPYCPIRTLRGGGPQVATARSGAEAFQIRSLVVGPRRPWLSAERSQGVALMMRVWRPSETVDYPDFPMQARESVARTAIAQAEYYSDWDYANRIEGTPDLSEFPGVMREEDTFYMHWRARLRVVRAPVDGDPEASDEGFRAFVEGQLEPACDRTCERLGDCGMLCDSLERFESVGAHVLH